jgi:hypothetical protein
VPANNGGPSNRRIEVAVSGVAACDENTDVFHFHVRHVETTQIQIHSRAPGISSECQTLSLGCGGPAGVDKGDANSISPATQVKGCVLKESGAAARHADRLCVVLENAVWPRTPANAKPSRIEPSPIRNVVDWPRALISWLWGSTVWPELYPLVVMFFGVPGYDKSGEFKLPVYTPAIALQGER